METLKTVAFSSRVTKENKKALKVAAAKRGEKMYITLNKAIKKGLPK